MVLRNCKKCGFKKWIKAGRVIEDGIWLRQYKCARKTCDNVQAEEPPPKPNTIKHPKKLYFDLERGFSKFLAFDRRVPSKYLSMPFEEGIVLGFAAAWLDEGGEFQYIYSNFVRQAEVLAGDDRRVLDDLWRMLDSADHIIGHNSDKYDLRLAKGRFDRWGMDFPWEAKQVDTLKLSKKHMMKMSYKLDDLTGGGKQEMEKEDWEKIAKDGDPASLLKMETYCRNDVRIGAEWFKDFARRLEFSGVKVWR